MPNPFREPDKNKEQDPTQVGASTPPGEGTMDKLQWEDAERAEGGEEVSNKGDKLSADVESSDLESDVFDDEPRQVQPELVTYMPRKDFEARVNQEQIYFRAGVPAKVTRDIANMLLEDDDRGYLRD